MGHIPSSFLTLFLRCDYPVRTKSCSNLRTGRRTMQTNAPFLKIFRTFGAHEPLVRLRFEKCYHVGMLQQCLVHAVNDLRIVALTEMCTQFEECTVFRLSIRQCFRYFWCTIFQYVSLWKQSIDQHQRIHSMAMKLNTPKANTNYWSFRNEGGLIFHFM